MTLALAIFWLSFLALLGTYIIYPLTMPLLSKVFGRDHTKGSQLPSVTLLISAYNESSVIREKLHNAFELVGCDRNKAYKYTS